MNCPTFHSKRKYRNVDHTVTNQINNLGLLFDLVFVWMYLSTAFTGYWIIHNKNRVEHEYYGYKR